MNESDERILRRCSECQAKTIREFLDKGWEIEKYDCDGYVLIKMGLAYRWVKPDGFSFAA